MLPVHTSSYHFKHGVVDKLPHPSADEHEANLVPSPVPCHARLKVVPELRIHASPLFTLPFWASTTCRRDTPDRVEPHLPVARRYPNPMGGRPFLCPALVSHTGTPISVWSDKTREHWRLRATSTRARRGIGSRVAALLFALPDSLLLFASMRHGKLATLRARRH